MSIQMYGFWRSIASFRVRVALKLKGLPFEEAARRLIASSGTQFDATVVNSFLPIAQLDMDTVFAAAGTSVNSAL